MPDNDRLAKLIERRKRQEKQNDRIRVHKNHLENMRLEKLSKFFDWSRDLLKREHLNREAKCIKNMEKIYHRQYKIEDERRAIEEKKRKEQDDKYKKKLESNQGDEIRERDRRRVMSANKIEQAKNFMAKVKTLSSGYRDNDPPQSYYKRHGIVPPQRVVTPEVSSSAQAQQGGGFMTPASAVHIKKLKKWHGAPAETEHRAVEEPVASKTPALEDKSDVTEADSKINKRDNESILGILEEREESDDEKMSTKSTENENTEIIKVKVVNIRPSTAPGLRTRLSSTDDTQASQRNPTELPKSGIVTTTGTSEEGDKPTGILHKKTTQRPATAGGVSFSGGEEGKELSPGDKRLRMRRQSSAISFADLPDPNGRRSSMRAPPLALLHRRQSNVAAIQRSIERQSKLLKPKKVKKKKTIAGSRMGLMHSVMSNVENDVLKRKLRDKSRCLQDERSRRWREFRAQSAPPGGRLDSDDGDDFFNYTSVRLIGPQLLNEAVNYRKNEGQKALLQDNVSRSKLLENKVKTFARPQTRA